VADVTADPVTRIVHIDPERDYRLLVRVALEPEPDLVVVGEAADAATGLSVVRSARADLVLVEPYVGPRADVEGLARLQAATPEGRTVVLTALPCGELDWTLRVSGARGHLSKQVRPSALADEIRQLVSVLTIVDGALDEARTELAIDLLVSEIVANAVLHARTDAAAELAVQLLPNRVRVAVTDRDPAQPKRRADDPLTSTGRGIALIERLSLAWGIDRLPGGKRIWFETPRPDRPEPEAAPEPEPAP
jgi:DNA-binding NarL/FixJ family response regulator